MAERFSSDLVFILVVLIVAALLGFLLGYLLKRGKSQNELKLEEENAKLITDLEACRKSMTAPQPVFDATAAQSAFGKKIRENDLKIVEGIGEKIESILKSQGILTWQQLAETSPARISEILLKEGGPSYRIHEPGTWPEQCLLASRGKWAELKDFQDKLQGGREV